MRIAFVATLAAAVAQAVKVETPEEIPSPFSYATTESNTAVAV